MRLFTLLLLATTTPAIALGQDAAADTSVRSGDEIPDDMPAPPDAAPPAEAPPVEADDGRPPHPQTPDPLQEEQPSAETLAKTSYHWFPGHWVWTGDQFEWKSGEWVYKVKGMVLVRPRWDWNGKQWVFHEAGWAEPGTNEVIYRTTPAPGGPDVASSTTPPPASHDRGGSSAGDDDDGLHLDRRVRRTADLLPDLAPVLPLPLVSPVPVPVLSKTARLSQHALSLRVQPSEAPASSASELPPPEQPAGKPEHEAEHETSGRAL